MVGQVTRILSFRLAGTRKGSVIDEIHLLLPRGAELTIDEVLLYEPGR